MYHSIVLCKTNVKNVVTTPPVGARLQEYWHIWLDLGAGPKVVSILREGYPLPFRIRPKLTRYPTVISCYANPRRNSYLLEALHQLIGKNAVEMVQNQTSLGFFNRLFLVPKPKNKWRPILDLSQLNLFLRVENFKMETPETIRTSLQQGEWVTSIDFKDAYFHIPIQEQSRKYLRFHVQGQTYQFKALPFGLSTAPMEFTVVTKEVKLMAIHKGIRIHQYLDEWLVRARSHQACLQHTQILVKLCQDLGWLVNLEKSELEPKQVFNFVGYQFDLRSGRVRPTTDQWQSLQEKIVTASTTGLSGPAVHVPDRSTDSHRKTSSPRSVTHEAHSVASQKQLAGTKITGKGDPNTQNPAPTSSMVAGGKQCAPRSTFTPNKTCSANLYRRIKRRVGHSLRSLPETKLHINFLELKAVFLALREFQDLCTNKTVLIATNNTTVVSYINKEGGMRSGPLCALLWRILTWCTTKQVTLKARHIPGRLNVVADKLSRLGQIIQTEWSLLPEIFQAICSRWHRPQIDLFATRFNNKLPLFVSPVPDSLATAVDALSLPWYNLDAYAFPPTAILGKVVEKLLDSPCNRVIPIASWISSWIKQTVILCYELSDQEAHTLHQVKAHDVRAFAASKAFQSGVSLEQILSACHWRSHNTFTQFYLKDVAWADSELYHLGPVVAAQQIHKQPTT